MRFIYDGEKLWFLRFCSIQGIIGPFSIGLSDLSAVKPNKYQRTGRDHFERWKLKGRSHKQSRIVEEALQEAIEEESSVLSLSDLFENEIEKIGNFVRTLNYDTEGKALMDFQVLVDRLGPIKSEYSALERHLSSSNLKSLL